MRKRILMIVVLCLFILNPIKVLALSPQVLINHHSYSEETETKIVDTKKEETSKNKRSILGELKYRLFEKDTRDLWDYLLLAIFVVGLLIVMVFMNTHYYIVKVPHEKEIAKLEDNDLVLVEKIEPKKSATKKNTITTVNKKRVYKKRDE